MGHHLAVHRGATVAAKVIPDNVDAGPASATKPLRIPRHHGDDSAGGGLRPGRVALVVSLIGLVVTASVWWTASTLNRNNEHRLLEVQTRQAANVVASSILGIENPLVTAVKIASATAGDTEGFTRFMSESVGPGRLFVSASLWRADGSSVGPVAFIGIASALAPASIEAQALMARAFHSATLVVTGIPPGNLQRIGYAIANTGSPNLAVYAERAIPSNRRVPVESDSAFSDLNFATYLGSTIRSSELATTNLPPGRLPLRGDTVRETIPFGDTTLTLVTSPIGHLGGSLGWELPWIFLVLGIVLTTATALVAEQLARRRRKAERDAQTISGLYEHLDDLYGEQRTIAETLQRALLPQRNPSIPNLEIASRYVAGAAGVDVGGDWYSLISVSDSRFAFVVGDVSGRGVGAATIMAQLRFTMRAYLLEGHSPDIVLEMCARQLDITRDGHFVTALVGIGDLSSREITVANAGHLNPLLISGTECAFVTAEVGLPLGLGPSTYRLNTIIMPERSTLVAFTDGLVERRGEDIEVGFGRLVQAATAPDPTLEGLLTGLLLAMNQDGPADDIAILAFRWLSPGQAEFGAPAEKRLSVGGAAPVQAGRYQRRIGSPM